MSDNESNNIIQNTSLKDSEYMPENKYVFFDIFTTRPEDDIDVNPNKANGKIKFPIVETILFENGQMNKWLFTSFQTGEVMKKKTNKLSKEFILMYYLQHLLSYLSNNENYKCNKSANEVMEDINKLNLLLERYNSSNKFPDDFKYLNVLNSKKFIYARTSEVSYSNSYHNFNVFETIKESDILSILEFSKLISDQNKLASIRVIQCFLDINLSFHPIICRFYKKNINDQRKLQIYTPLPDKDNHFNISKKVDSKIKDEIENVKNKSKLKFN